VDFVLDAIGDLCTPPTMVVPLVEFPSSYGGVLAICYKLNCSLLRSWIRYVNWLLTCDSDSVFLNDVGGYWWVALFGCWWSRKSLCLGYSFQTTPSSLCLLYYFASLILCDNRGKYFSFILRSEMTLQSGNVIKHDVGYLLIFCFN